MKLLVRELALENKHLKKSMLSALGNIQPRHLMDKRLADF